MNAIMRRKSNKKKMREIMFPVLSSNPLRGRF